MDNLKNTILTIEVPEFRNYEPKPTNIKVIQEEKVIYANKIKIQGDQITINVESSIPLEPSPVTIELYYVKERRNGNYFLYIGDHKDKACLCLHGQKSASPYSAMAMVDSEGRVFFLYHQGFFRLTHSG